MQDFEKLGAFYLGQQVDGKTQKASGTVLLADARDFTTHAVIVGMTGSGKTGLGIGLIEEAAIDKIPVIAVDPKGDLGNVLLTFPLLAPADFRPWVDERSAQEQGLDADAFATKQAAAWKGGLEASGQDGARIQRLRDAADFAIYTPGSVAGLPLSVLGSFSAPPAALKDDPDAWRERVTATATGVLTLVGVDGDPVQSREHILLGAILEQAWGAGRDLDLAGLVAAIQQPPMARVGVMDVESFYPGKERFALAMKLNGLLASSGFAAWTQGEPLSAAALLHTAGGRPRVSVMSIAHLSDSERMFFMSLLLAELISWMRSQPGTGTLRALLYIDELFGYMPPTANPPTKMLLLTLLKQARAFGLGVVLSTQNPVDLDYKGLSNAGLWFVGRLQTERDKKRLMDGLEGAASGGSFDRGTMEGTIAGLGKRVFLMHSVKEPEPVLFSTRWTLSYLAGPLTRDQVKSLMSGQKPAAGAAPAARVRASGAAGAPAAATVGGSGAVAPASATPSGGARPVLAPAITQYFLPLASRGAAGAQLVYTPMAAGAADIVVSSTRYNVNETTHLVRLAAIESGPVPVDWGQGEDAPFDASQLEQAPAEGAAFADVPKPAADPKQYSRWSKLFSAWAKESQAMTLYSCSAPKVVSNPGEGEGEFRARLQVLARESRDGGVAKLREKYAARVASLTERLRVAEARVAKERSDAAASKLQAAVGIGSAILGAVLGRKAISAATLNRVGTAARGVARAGKESGDVARAGESAEAIRQQLAAIEAEVTEKAQGLGADFDAATVALVEIPVKPKPGDITVHYVALAWAPHWKSPDGTLVPAWKAG
ncbi:MAG: ATP-binding protein [Gemmatimonadetes bacterium]|nr:ATP-binding protein [Gemmatimonadota bacterium]